MLAVAFTVTWSHLLAMALSAQTSTTRLMPFTAVRAEMAGAGATAQVLRSALLPTLNTKSVLLSAVLPSPAMSTNSTMAGTTLGSKDVGDPVNLEVDVIAKYVERLVGARR